MVPEEEYDTPSSEENEERSEYREERPVTSDDAADIKRGSDRVIDDLVSRDYDSDPDQSTNPTEKSDNKIIDRQRGALAQTGISLAGNKNGPLNSPNNGRRWIKIQTRWNIAHGIGCGQPASNDIVIRKKPIQGVGYDPVVQVRDLTHPQGTPQGPSHIHYFGDWIEMNYAFGNYVYGTTNVDKVLEVTFASGFKKEFTILHQRITNTWLQNEWDGQFWVGCNVPNIPYGPNPDSPIVKSNFEHWGCDTPAAYNAPNLLGQGYGWNPEGLRHYSTVNNNYHIYTKWKWYSDPGGAGVNLEWLAEYDASGSYDWMPLMNNANSWQYNFASDIFGGAPGAGSNGRIDPDQFEFGPQEIHRIDTILFQATDWNGLIQGQTPDNYWQNLNFTQLGSGQQAPTSPYHVNSWYNDLDVNSNNLPPQAYGAYDFSSFRNFLKNRVDAPFHYTIYYAENLHSCPQNPRGTTYYACTDDKNPGFYGSLTSLQGSLAPNTCNTITIPADDLPGGANYLSGLVTYIHSQDCCVVCNLATQGYTVNSNYGADNGEIHWSATNPAFGWNPTGTPWTEGSRYTVTLSTSTGAAIAQTNAAAGNSTTTVTGVSTVNGSNELTLASGSDLITEGMNIKTSSPTNITFYDAASGGNVVTEVFIDTVTAGVIGNNVTKFTVCDNVGSPVYLQATAGSKQIGVGTGWNGVFGSLVPNTVTGLGSNSYYILTIVDNTPGGSGNGCTETITFVVGENKQVSGCTDSGALNYSATANSDDGSCIKCAYSTADNSGRPFATNGNANQVALFDSSNIQTISTTNSSTNDGKIHITAYMNSTIQSYLAPSGYASTQTYTMTLYPVSTYGDFGTAGSALETKTGIPSHGASGFGGAPQHIFGDSNSPWSSSTSIPYGHYAIKVEYEDSTGTPDAEICYSLFYVTVKAKSCPDATNINYEPSLPSQFREDDQTLCAQAPTQCCNMLGINLSSDSGPCHSVLKVVGNCDPPASGGISFLVEFDDGSGFITIDNFTNWVGQYIGGTWVYYLTDTGQGSGSQNYYQIYGEGTYRVTMQAFYGGNVACQVTRDLFVPGTLYGCMDPGALNYDPDAQCPTTCVYESYECVACQDCQDPWNIVGADLNAYLAQYPNGGQYSSISQCLAAATCQCPAIPGCTDSCATNYDPAATQDDGSCVFGACLDPTASNEFFDCDCNGGTYIYAATVNKQGCCTYSCSPDPTIQSTTTDTTGTCSGGNSDGTANVTVDLLNASTSWTVHYEDSSGNIIFTDTTTYTSGQQSATQTGFNNGVFTAVVEDNNNCITNHTFTIGISGVTFGCTDPTDACYDANATCDDGTCCGTGGGVCGCMDPNASNYDPHATIPCPCEYPPVPPNPCVPELLDDLLKGLSSCLIKKGQDYLSSYKIGFNDDCSLMSHWKLILINYLFQQKDLGCLYNCEGGYTSFDPNAVFRGDCGALWAAGGPSTGPNHDANHTGASVVNTGEGTTVTAYDGYPNGWFGFDNGAGPNGQSSNITYVGDYVKWDLPTTHHLASKLNGTIWKLTTPPATGTAHQGNVGFNYKHYTQCIPANTVTYTDTTAYIVNFINFVTQFCVDCKNPKGINI